MKLSNSKIIFLILVIFNVPSFSHQDTIIKIENGMLIGLPEKYNPATINTDSLIIKINDSKLEFPTWFKQHIKSIKNYKLNISASWYHDLNIAPPVINIRLENKLKGFAYIFVFNLDTKEIHSISVRLNHEDDSWINHKLDMEYN